jgi:hypothetical protein
MSGNINSCVHVIQFGNCFQPVRFPEDQNTQKSFATCFLQVCYVRFEVLTAVKTSMLFLRNVDIYRSYYPVDQHQHLHSRENLKSRIGLSALSYFEITVLWHVAPCSLVEIDRRFKGAYHIHHQGDRTSVTSASFYQNTRRNLPEDSHLHTRRRENLKSHLIIFVCVSICPNFLIREPLGGFESRLHERSVFSLRSGGANQWTVWNLVRDSWANSVL